VDCVSGGAEVVGSDAGFSSGGVRDREGLSENNQGSQLSVTDRVLL
jgi:hypothetical protein